MDFQHVPRGILVTMEKDVPSSAAMSDGRLAPDLEPHSGEFDGTPMEQWQKNTRS